MTEANWLELFSSNLRKEMMYGDVNQRELARKAGLSESSISEYLKGRKMPGVKAVLNIAYVLEIDVSELIDFDEMID